MGEPWLILETAGRVGRVGLARGGVVAAAALDPARRHARDLAATVDRLLRDAGLVPRDLAGVMVAVGPGGYTGLRVGVMTAKALAFATGCKLVAVPSFPAIAEQAPSDATQLWVIGDALKGLIYLQRFRREGTGWEADDDLRIVPAAEWLPRAAGGVWVSGPGLTTHAALLPPDVPAVNVDDREPRVEAVYAVGTRLTPLTREELFRLEPLYLRGSSAEEQAGGGR